MLNIPTRITLPSGSRIEFAGIGREIEIRGTDAAGEAAYTVRVSQERARQIVRSADRAGGEPVIDISGVLAALAELERIKGDDEAAHSDEDDLREKVLRAIAEGAPDAQGLAQAVLRSSDIEFSRWCA